VELACGRGEAGVEPRDEADGAGKLERRRSTQCSTDHEGLEAMTDPSQIPEEVRIARECSAALGRGDKPRARELAEQGLRLAEANGSAEWQHRFQHLLCGATDAPQNGPPICSFCGNSGERARKILGGPIAFICDECVERSSRPGDSVGPERVFADDVPCSFCDRRPAQQPLFVGQGHFICSECIDVCIEQICSGRSRP